MQMLISMFCYVSRKQSIDLIYSDTLQPECTIQKFNCDQLQGCCRCKAGPNGNKTSPKGRNSVLLCKFHGTINESIVCFGIALVHESRSNSIKRTYSACHGESTAHGGTEGCAKILSTPSSSIRHRNFGLRNHEQETRRRMV
jgi:hypothetical protein